MITGFFAAGEKYFNLHYAGFFRIFEFDEETR